MIANSSESSASRFAFDDRFSFAAGNPRQLAARIDHLMNDPIELREGREHARALSKRWTLDDGVNRMLSVYQDLHALRFASSI